MQKMYEWTLDRKTSMNAESCNLHLLGKFSSESVDKIYYKVSGID